MTRQTVSKVASDLLAKETHATTPIEQMEESLSEYEQNLRECVDTAKRTIIGDFYVVVLTKRERLMQNVFRCYFFPRMSCPTPDWDQTVYKYKHKDDNTVYMWTIPSKDACEYLTLNALQIPNEERELLKYVLSFNDGSLMKFAKELNGEKAESVELEGFTWKGDI